MTVTTPGQGRRRPRRRDPRYPRILLGAAIAVVSIGSGVASAQTVTEPEAPDALEPSTGEPTAGAVAPSDDAIASQTDDSTDETTGTTDETDDVDDAVEGPEETGDDGSTDAGGNEGRNLARRPRRGDGITNLKLQRAAPRRVIYRGTRAAAFRFEIGGRRTRDLRVQLLKKGSRRVIRGWGKQDVEPGSARTVAWNGARRHGGEPPKGVYYFRVVQKNGEILDRRQAEGDRTVRLYSHKFPVRARHDYWDGWGAGRGHKGQDIGARCGAKLVAARAGRVQWKAYQGGGAGYYVVIDGKRTRLDYVYMHLRKPAVVSRGERVKAGQRIGAVGASGNASGCHLHFELWKGDWYGGGDPMWKVTRYLRRWDRWT